VNPNKLVQAFSKGFQKVFQGNLWQWCEQNLTLPVGAYAITGPFNTQISPYLNKPMEDMTDPAIRQVNIASSTQTGKSLIQEVLAPYIVLQDPSPVLRVFPTDVMASTCMNTRILPLLRTNANTNNLLNLAKYNGKTGVLNLGNQFIKACGTSENNLHSLSIKTAILDEVWLYDDANVVDKVRSRLSAFENSSKLILTSQPDTEGSQLHKEYMKGNVYHYGWTCPSCKKLQPYEFQGTKDGKHYGLVWTPQNEEKTLTPDERTDNTRMVCQHCFHEVTDTEDNRIAMVQNGAYIQIKTGDRTINSYSWPTYVNKDITYKKIAMQYFKAKEVYDKTGIDNDMKLFRNQKLAQFWKIGEQITAPKLLQDTSLGSEEWLDETHRFLTVDVQAGHMYWLVTAWSNKVSEARLVDWGVCVGFDELVNIRKKYNVSPISVGIDSGTDTVALYKESILRGEKFKRRDNREIWATWICLKGDGGHITPRVDYLHPDGQRRYYGVESRPDPQWPAGSPWAKHRATHYVWSNLSIKTVLSSMIAGKLPFNFRFNKRADETFTAHMDSERLDPKTGRYKPKTESTPNHLWDCMCMALVMALMARCFIPEATIGEDEAIKQAKAVLNQEPAALQTNPT